MAKLWSTALALFAGAGVWAGSAMAQSNADALNNDADTARSEVDGVQRGGGEGTTLSKKGLHFSTDGFELHMANQVQFRMTYYNEVGNGSNGSNGRDYINFRIRRAKTALSGHIFDKKFQYKVVLGWTPHGGQPLEVAEFSYTAVEQYLTVNAGLNKTHFNWEESTSSKNLNFVERSYANEIFNQGYATGVGISGRFENWVLYNIGVYNGVLAGNNDFRNANRFQFNDNFAHSVVDNEMMMALRLETHPLGEVPHGFLDLRGEDEYGDPIFAIGLGFNWFVSGVNDAALRGSNNPNTPASGRSDVTQDTMSLTLDGHFRIYGFGVDFAIFYRKTEFHNNGRNTTQINRGSGAGASIGDLTDMGWTFEVSYVLNISDDWGKLAFGIRVSNVDADEFWNGAGGNNAGRAFAVMPDTMVYGVAVNWLLYGDNLKLTLDISYVDHQLADSYNGTNLRTSGLFQANAPTRSGAAGSVGRENGDHQSGWAVRIQLQWLF